MQKRKFAVFDIDGTLVRWQLYHAVADELARSGHVSPLIYDQVKAARLKWKKRAHKDAFKNYEHELIKSYEQVLQDITGEQFDAAVKAAIGKYKDQTYTYTRGLIKQLRAQDYLLFAISGSQRELIAKLAQHYGFDDFIGTDYTRVDGRFTGEIVFHAQDKKKALEGLVDQHNATYKGSLAIGDSANDTPMLNLVEIPIAFNPDQTLLEAAKKHGWKIVIERKNVVYELVSDSKGLYTLN